MVLKNILQRKLNKEEDGVALILAIIIILVIGAILTNVIMLNVKSSEKSFNNRDWIVNGQAVESALQNALAMANSSAQCPIDLKSTMSSSSEYCLGYYAKSDAPYNWAKGSDGEINWQWRAKEVTVDGKTAYDIFAIAAHKSTDMKKAGRGLIARLTYNNVIGYEVDKDGTIQYIQPGEDLFGWNALAQDDLIVDKNAKFFSYDDNYPSKIASNGDVNFSAGSNNSSIGLSAIDLLNSAKNVGTERCKVGGASNTGLCASNAGLVKKQDMAYSLGSIYNQTLDKCGVGKQKEWVASQAETVNGNALLKAGCYSNIVVDKNTVVTQEDGSMPDGSTPAYVYISDLNGTYTQKSGTSIQSGDDSGGVDNNPSNFSLYSIGSQSIPSIAPNSYRGAGENRRLAVIFENEKDISGNSIVDAISFNGVIGATAGSCSTSDGTRYENAFGMGDRQKTTYPRTLSFTGSIACKSIFLGPMANLSWDPSINDIEKNLNNSRQIWTNTSYSSATPEDIFGIEFNGIDENQEGGM